MQEIELAVERIRGELEQRGMPEKRLIVAIDGPAAAGKTTLGEALARALGETALVHMDDFFLPQALRTPERFAQPGGNVHWERVLQEVLEPLSRGETACYGVFDCGAMAVTHSVCAEPAPVVIVEGSYSLHPALRGYYDLRVFLTLEPGEQLARIRRRNGEAGLERFRSRWIPLEERYFAACAVRACAELVL